MDLLVPLANLGVAFVVALCFCRSDNVQEMSITGKIDRALDVTQTGTGKQTIRGLDNGDVEINGAILRGDLRGRRITNRNDKLYVDGQLMKIVDGQYVHATKK